MITNTDLDKLKAPFSRDRLGVKVQSLNKDRTRAMLVLYLQHTDVQSRLEEVDPAWTFEVVGEERFEDTVYVRGRLTLKGISRENVGEGGDPKAAHSDALKRCAMLFGVGRYLYDSETVWAEYNEAKDKFRQWTVEDYQRAGERRGIRAPVAEKEPRTPKAEEGATPGLTRSVTSPVKSSKSKTNSSSSEKVPAKPERSREQLNRVLMGLYRPFLTKFPETRFVDLLQERYQVGETRLMTLEQIEDLVQYLEARLAAAA